MGITVGTFRIPKDLRDSMWMSFCSTSAPIKLHRRKKECRLFESQDWIRLKGPGSLTTPLMLHPSQHPFQLVSSFPFVILSAFWSVSPHRWIHQINAMFVLVLVHHCQNVEGVNNRWSKMPQTLMEWYKKMLYFPIAEQMNFRTVLFSVLLLKPFV